MSTSTRASSSPEGDDDPKSAPVALVLGAMVAVGSPIAAPGVVVNILGSMADDGVRFASEDIGVTLAGSLDDDILVYGEKQLGGGGGSRIVYPAPN
jgi:hypothetical protein